MKSNKLEEAVIKALQGKLIENKDTVSNLVKELWEFDNGEYYKEVIDMYNSQDAFVKAMLDEQEISISDPQFDNYKKAYIEIYKKCNNEYLESKKIKKESITIEDAEYFAQRLDDCEDMDDIQQLINEIPDGVLENEVQEVFNQCEIDKDDLDTVKSLVSTTFEDNAEYDELDESKKPVVESTNANYIVIFFDKDGYNPPGSDGVYYSSLKTREGTLQKVLSNDFAKNVPYTNFIIITPSEYDRMSGSNWEEMKDYIKQAMQSGHYYSQKVESKEIKTEDTNSDEKTTITLKVNDPDQNIENLLNTIKSYSTSGHSFQVIVDPDDEEYKKTFGIDGDGADQLLDIQVSKPEKQEESKEKEYIVKYLSTEGKEKEYKYNSDKELNKAQIITKLKSDVDDFVKLL